MSYYQSQGDFYQSQGDPFFGALAGLALGGLSKLFKRSPKSVPGAGLGERVAMGVGTAIGTMRKHPVISGAGGLGLGLVTGAGISRMGGRAPMMAAPGQRGFHISKRTGKLVRNRRMRVTNTKALRRAIRRAEGFSRIAKKVLHFTSPRRVHGRGVFRIRRRKRVA